MADMKKFSAPLKRGESRKRKQRRLTGRQKAFVGVGIVAAVLAAVGSGRFKSRAAGNGEAGAVRTAVAQRMSITSSLSSAGTLSPKDTYTITSLVSGDVVSAEFEEGGSGGGRADPVCHRCCLRRNRAGVGQKFRGAGADNL